MEKFQGPNPSGKYVLTARNQNLVFSLPLVGSVFGGLLASPMNYHLGRKWPLIIAYIVSVGGGLLQVFAPNLGAFIGGRSINAVALGIVNATAPLYIAEVRSIESFVCEDNLISIGGSCIDSRQISQFNQHLESHSWSRGHSSCLSIRKDPRNPILPDPTRSAMCSARHSILLNNSSSRKPTMAGGKRRNGTSTR